MLLVTGMEAKTAFAVFAVPSILAALGYFLVQEKYASFDRIVEEDDEKDNSFVSSSNSVSR